MELTTIEPTNAHQVAALANKCHAHLKALHGKHFHRHSQPVRDILEARMQSNKETCVAAMVHLYNDTDNRDLKVWLLATAWELEFGNINS